ncbi:PrsW family glutamic-type intramembrane protease [Saccharopolyspora sp. SCSIO 74807]|uniref:PrsW family glutamic-type intramembrane protease n=1 Tax=Saccharopolyspora sp. SCSIO 74807 TaxID=3118084 RepID=UPI0030CDC924
MSHPDLPGPDLSGARRLQTRKHSAVGLPVAGLLVLGVVGLVMVGVATSRVGALPALVGALAALIPVGVVFAAIVWIDRWEPEPPLLMLGAFLWGAGGATACSLLLNDSVVGLGELLFGPSRHVFFERALMAPLVEEGAKALFVVALWFRRRSEFNGLVDGIVYASLTAAGFAFTENILYFGKAFAEGGLGNATGGVVAVFILRGVLAPFSHPLFSAMVGIGIGLASRTADNRRRVLWPLLGYLGAVVLHAAWNASTLLSGTGFLNMYFLIMVPIFAGTGWLIVWQRKREQRIVVDQLPVLQRAGLIVRSEVEMLASLAGRQGWLRKVRRSAGADAAKAVRDYQIAVTELAFLQHRAAEGRTTSAVRRARREQLIEELKAARREAVGSREGFQTARVKIHELTQSVRRPAVWPTVPDDAQEDANQAGRAARPNQQGPNQQAPHQQAPHQQPPPQPGPPPGARPAPGQPVRNPHDPPNAQPHGPQHRPPQSPPGQHPPNRPHPNPPPDQHRPG